jgi:uncharacterized membrane protein
MSEAPLVIMMHPYRSLGPSGFRALIGVVIGVNAVGALYFAFIGAWPVAGFMGLDVLALHVALRLSFAQARAFERISIDDRMVTIENCDRSGRLVRETMPSYWAQVVFDGDDTQGTISLRSHGRAIAVGTHLPGPERQLFADRLRQALRDARGSAGAVEA